MISPTNAFSVEAIILAILSDPEMAAYSLFSTRRFSIPRRKALPA
jgi:hypothetical protein